MAIAIVIQTALRMARPLHQWGRHLPDPDPIQIQWLSDRFWTKGQGIIRKKIRSIRLHFVLLYFEHFSYSLIKLFASSLVPIITEVSKLHYYII